LFINGENSHARWVLERSQAVSNGLKRFQSATKPWAPSASARLTGTQILRNRRRRAHPRVSSSLIVPRNPGRRAHPRVSSNLKVPRNPGRRVHPRVSIVFKVPRNPGCRAHTRVSNGHAVPRNSRRRAHPRVSNGLNVPPRPWRRAHSRVSHGFQVPRNPGRRAHPRVSQGFKVFRNPRRRAHPRVSSGLKRATEPSASSASARLTRSHRMHGARARVRLRWRCFLARTSVTHIPLGAHYGACITTALSSLAGCRTCCARGSWDRTPRPSSSTESWQTTIGHYRTMASSACQTKATGYMLFPSTPRRHAIAQACHSAQTRTEQAWNHATRHTPREYSTTGALMKTPQNTRPRRERGIRFQTFLLGLKEAV